MRTRSLGLTLLATAAIIVAACSTGGGGSQAPAGGLKIGFVTDVGTLEDKSFNEAAWLAVQDAKTKHCTIVDEKPVDWAH
mgnify:CR=1 FL=1